MITSRNNPQIRDIRKLLTRKGRQASGTFIAEGIRQVTALVSSRHDIQMLVVAPDLLTSRVAWDLVGQHRARGGECLQVSQDVFRCLSIRDNPQGLACVGYARIGTLRKLGDPGRSLWVALIDPQDPGNLGTIVRTCDAVGASGMIIVGGGVDPYHPTAIRASAGAIFTCDIVRANFAELHAWSRESNFELVGTSDTAEFDYRMPSTAEANGTILVMGSERQGMPDEMKQNVDRMIRVPMVGICDSLNLAVATSVILYELARQRLSTVQ